MTYQVPMAEYVVIISHMVSVRTSVRTYVKTKMFCYNVKWSLGVTLRSPDLFLLDIRILNFNLITITML